VQEGEIPDGRGDGAGEPLRSEVQSFRATTRQQYVYEKE
jgi:hypothetical protein